jgi:hypothetical protein
VVNLVVYAVDCVLLLLFFDGFLGSESLSTFASLLFAVHPIHTEAVAGIVGRADLLAGFFFLLSLIAYSNSVPSREVAREAAAKVLEGAAKGKRVKKDTDSEGDDSEDDEETVAKHAAAAGLNAECKAEDSVGALMWACVSVVLAGMGMLCKEQAVTALGLCLIYDFVFNDGLFLLQTPSPSSSPFRTSLRFRHRHLIVLIGLGLILYARLMFMGQVPKFVATDNPAAASKSFTTKVLTFNYLYALNGGLLLYPRVMSCDWASGSIALITSVEDPRNGATLVLYSLAFLALACLLTTQMLPSDADRRTLVLGLAMVVVPATPAMGLVATVGFVLAGE